MSEINVNNYQAYMLDYSEGNLSPQEVAELLLFLSENPEYSNELPDSQLPALTPEQNHSFNEKESLMAVAPLTGLTDDTADLYFIADVEKQLDSHQIKELDAFLRKNPDQERSHSLYQQTILKPEENVTFGSKSTLYKTKVVSLRSYYQYSAIAASIMLFIYFGIFFKSEESKMSVGLQLKNVPSKTTTNFAYQSKVSLIHPLYNNVKEEIQTAPLKSVVANKRQSTQNEVEVVDLLSSSDIEILDTVKQLSIKDPVELVNNEIDDKNNDALNEATILKKESIAQVQTPEEYKSKKTQPLSLNQYLKKLVGKRLLDSDEKMKALEEDRVDNLALQIADDVVPNLDFKKNQQGEVLAYSFRIGGFGISRKSGKN